MSSAETGIRLMDAALERRMIEIRRHLHRYLELSNEECDTQAYLMRALEEAGLRRIRPEACFGLAVMRSARLVPPTASSPYASTSKCCRSRNRPASLTALCALALCVHAGTTPALRCATPPPLCWKRVSNISASRSGSSSSPPKRLSLSAAVGSCKKGYCTTSARRSATMSIPTLQIGIIAAGSGPYSRPCTAARDFLRSKRE
jgi:hypothetical protein